MSLRINQNILSIKTHGVLAATSSSLEKSIEKLSSGLRINRAADDAAGLAISEKMRRTVRGLNRAVLNAQDGISMIQTAEGALNESHSILQRVRELAIQAGNDTLTSNDRLEIQKEVNQLRDDLNRIAKNTEFNTKKLLDGSQSALVSSSSKNATAYVVGNTNGGGDFDVDLTLLSGGISQMQRSQIFTEQGSGDLAQGSTKLQDISQFYDANGVFILESPQSVTVSGNSKSASITLDGQMTLDELAAAIQNALASVGGLGVSNSKAGVVGTAMTNIANLGGYLEIASGTVGRDGDVAFAGDQGVMDSLGLTVTRESVDSLVEVSLSDGSGGNRVVRTSTDRATGLLQGIDLVFSSQAAQVGGTQGLETGLELTGAETFTISAGGQSVTISVTVGFYSMEGLARSINAQLATISGMETSVVDGNLRLSFTPTAASIASTISIGGATTGASTMGFLDGTSSGFTDASKNVNNETIGFSAYRSTVVATAVVFSVGDGIDNVDLTAFTTVSAATVADFVAFNTFQDTMNAAMVAASVDVRVDQAGDAMAFTSLRVGKENLNGQAPISSMVTFNTADTDALIKFGLNNGTAKGEGDMNFRVHVVDNKPQFQIGSDQGQIMRVSMQNMTAEALGVDNLDLTSVAGANNALGLVSQAIDRVSAERSKLGAFQNRLEYAISNLRNTHSNMVAAESRIRDADIAQEMIGFTRNQIVQQSGTAMLAQANLVPQGVLQLLR